jgi:DNA polymerase I-like protein with 3'-5' exonuclease and polymerase domains
MLALDNEGYTIVNSVHDELLLLGEESKAKEIEKRLTEIMSTAPKLAENFPLACETWTAKRYKK